MCAVVHLPKEFLPINLCVSALLHPSRVSVAGGLPIIRLHGGGSRGGVCNDSEGKSSCRPQTGNPSPDPGSAYWDLSPADQKRGKISHRSCPS